MSDLTCEYILSLPAGRLLDAAVAEHVFGWRLTGPDAWSAYTIHCPGAPDWTFTMSDAQAQEWWDPAHVLHYSTDIVATWLLVEHYQQRDFGGYLGLFPSRCLECRVEIVAPLPLLALPDVEAYRKSLVRNGGMLTVLAPTIQVGVCRAALLASLPRE